jgi:ketosteroid isomerase-like protein
VTAAEHLRAYEAALGTQEWALVEPLLHDDVCVTFSDGSVHRGKQAVGAAFSRNFELIEDEQYELSDVEWIAADPTHAVCVYRFRWSGRIDGKPASGGGRGTTVLKLEDGGWLVLVEHLGPEPRPAD